MSIYPDRSHHQTVAYTKQIVAMVKHGLKDIRDNGFTVEKFQKILDVVDPINGEDRFSQIMKHLTKQEVDELISMSEEQQKIKEQIVESIDPDYVSPSASKHTLYEEVGIVKEALRFMNQHGFHEQNFRSIEELLSVRRPDKVRAQELSKALSKEEKFQIVKYSKYALTLTEQRLKDKEAVVTIFKWIEEKDFKTIQKNEASRAHKLADVIKAEQMLPWFNKHNAKGDPIHDRDVKYEAMMKLPSFVLKHDWTAALGDLHETGKTIEFRLPFPTCLFEFMVEGKCVIVMASEQETGEIRYLNFIEFEKDRWFEAYEQDVDMEKLFSALRRQITACCVALSAKVAEHSQVEPAIALNKKRIKSGRTPLKSYHVIDLSKRYRTKLTRSEEHSDRKSPRLHWRRGHWRRVADKDPIFIDWMLVGNVDLGYIDKHYLI